MQARKEWLDHTGPRGCVKSLSSVENYANKRAMYALSHNQNSVHKYLHIYTCTKGN